MKIRAVVFLVLMTSFLAAASVSAQRSTHERGGHPAEANRPRANQGRIPAAPSRSGNPAAVREPEHLSTGHVNDLPHVSNNHWYGHESANDPRFRLDKPFEHGRFSQFGPSFRYRVLRVDRVQHMFWLPGGANFQIAAWDWPLFADWCWDCGDDFVVYEDPDHLGWYMVYNVHLGTYVHATYIGI